MNKPRLTNGATLGITFAVGAATMLLFHLHLLMSWQGIYSKYPWNGQEVAMAQGMIKPHFAQSTLSFNVARMLLLVVAAVVGYVHRRNCVPAGFVLWIGAASIPALIIATDAAAHHGQFGFLAVVFVALLHGFFIFWPVFGGILAGAALSALISRFWPSAAKQSHAPDPPVKPLAKGESPPPAL
jgi:hypothetical protein